MSTKNSFSRILLASFAVFTSVWLVAPMFMVVPISFAENASFRFPPQGFSTRWYEQFFNDPSWLDVLGNSLFIGLLTVAIAAPLGTVVALAINRSQSSFAGWAQMIMITPMIVPPIIAGAGIYRFFLYTDLVGTFFGFVFVHVTLALPLVMIAVNATLAGYDRTLELAASSLGASRLKTFLTITVPLIAPGVAAGGVFAFVISFDEIIISQFMVSPALQTLPVAMYSSVTRSTDPTIAAVATLILLTVIVGFAFYHLVVLPLSKRRGVVKKD